MPKRFFQEHQPRDVPGCQVAVFRGGWVRNVVGVWLTSQCQALTHPNHSLTAAKALPSAHVQRSGARAGLAGRAAWCASCMWNANDSGGHGLQCCSMSVPGAQGSEGGEEELKSPGHISGRGKELRRKPGGDLVFNTAT